MSIEIKMPALSPTMEEGTLAKWLVKEGDTVSAGDLMAEIETDKATMEFEAVDEGTIAKIVVPEGAEGVKVGDVIAILAEEGEDASAVEAPKEKKAEAPKKEEKAEAPEKTAGGAKSEAKVQETRVEREQAAAPSAPSQDGDGERVKASPLARRIAAEKGIELSALDGSGPGGRIVKADVEGAKPGAAPAKKAEATAPVAAPAPAAAPAEAKAVWFDESIPHEEEKLSNIRKTIARRLTEAKQTIPSYLLTMECDIAALLRLREEINGSAPVKKSEKGDAPAFKLSVNDFIIKAMALALRDVPMANASWTSSARVIHKHADVGVAVAIPDGLITPIVRHAEEKTLSVISNEMKDLAKRARDKKLKPEEYQGGTTAVSNLGMFGVSSFTSIINPPHASIVSIGAGVETPVVKNGAVAVTTMMNATFAFDHRVIDGALGAELAAAFKRYVESPMGMLI
jgi:pyruvate dehydrogenase E2 component (dihydrolipoamide acetyltransferase)